MEYILEAEGIEKHYGTLIANRGVNLKVRKGEVHAVMGENGAGKSTLMAMLFGMVRPTAGKIRLRGQIVEFSSTLDAIAAKIGMVHQAFKLFPNLTVWENIVFGSEPRRGPLIDTQAARRRIAELARTHHLDIDPNAIVGQLPIGKQQRVEILKALYRDAEILILDEPTAVLAPAERDGLLKIMRELADKGKTLLFVTHKLNEIMAVADRVTVMRRGEVTDQMETAETTSDAIIRAMTGRDVSHAVTKLPTLPGQPRLELQDVTMGAMPKPALNNVTFTVRAGEIVGIAGVAGNGQAELVDAITGQRRVDGGTVVLSGTFLTGLSTRARRELGMAIVPEDRHHVGSVARMPAFINMSMGKHRVRPLSVGGLIDRQAMREHAKRLIERFGVAIQSPDTKVDTLSGGNLQKLIVARELDHQAPFLLIEQPTRGVDVGAIEYIHKVLVEERTAGKAILLISSELPELLALCDRILVLYEGEIIKALSASQTDEKEIGFYMAGGKEAK